jgi:hypothetical protein
MAENKKKIAIVCDNYKLKKFKKELTKKGFTDFETTSYIGETTIINLKTTDANLKKVEKICRSCENHFKHN